MPKEKQFISHLQRCEPKGWLKREQRRTLKQPSLWKACWMVRVQPPRPFLHLPKLTGQRYPEKVIQLRVPVYGQNHVHGHSPCFTLCTYLTFNWQTIWIISFLKITMYRVSFSTVFLNLCHPLGGFQAHFGWCSFQN